MRTILLLTIALGASTAPGAVDEPLRAQAVQVLRTSLDQESRWGKVHAAEALLATGNGDGVARAFERELTSHGEEKEYRIGIWRVLAQAAASEPQRGPWVRKIVAAFLDTAGPNRLHAAEALGKLGYGPIGREAGAFELAARVGRGPLAVDAQWVLVNRTPQNLVDQSHDIRPDHAHLIQDKDVYLPNPPLDQGPSGITVTWKAVGV